VEEPQKSTIAEQKNSASEESQKSTDAEPQKSTERTKIGWAIRTDLITAFKTMAAQQRKRDYQIVEEAMEFYLNSKQAH
jgi:hypothetical protein